MHGYTICDTEEHEPDFEKVAIYLDHEDDVHAARQLPSGRWTSKLGEKHDLEHNTLKALEADTRQYPQACGSVVQIMKRPIDKTKA